MNATNIRKLIGSASIAGALLAAGTGALLLAHAESPQPGEAMPALQIQADASRDRVWVLSVDGIAVYDGAARNPVRRVALPDWVVLAERHSCAPALALTPSGSALVASNALPVLWEVDAASLAVRRIDLALNTDNDREVGFTGLAFGLGGGDLYGVSSTAGSAWQIDLAAGKASKLRLAMPVQGDCGASVLSAVAPGPVAAAH